MTYNPIANVGISLDISTTGSAGFGTAMFIDDNVWFKGRSQSYSSITEAAENLPTNSKAYKAIVSAFSRDIKPVVVKVGRRDPDTITIVPDAITASGQTRAITVVGTDDVAVTAAFTSSTGSETQANVTGDWATDLAGLVGVTVVDNGGSLTLSKSTVDAYAITSTTNVTFTTVTTETAAETLAAIRQEDDEFYFFGCSDKDPTFIQALATEAEALNKEYWVTVSDTANLGAYSDVATDTLSVLKQNTRYRTFGFYHQDAEDTFPEMEYISILSISQPGRTIAANEKVSTGESRNADTNFPLSTTEKSNLVDKNASYTERYGNVVITRGTSSAAEPTYLASDIRDRDFLVARITEAYQNFLINNRKVIFTQGGVDRVEGVLKSVLDRYISTPTQPNILQELDPYVIRFPKRKDISFTDVANGVFLGEFTAYLAGSIRSIEIRGSLTYDANF